MENPIHFLLFFSLGLFCCLVINQLLLSFSESLGIRIKNDITVRWSNSSKPSLGGISIFIGFFAAIIFYMIITPKVNLFSQKEFVYLFIAASLGFLMGLADDAYNTRPLLKLMIQIICGLLISYGGTYIKITDVLSINILFTTLWVVLIMNSLNMLDNMDGITSIVCLFIFTTCLIANIIFKIDSHGALNFILITIIGSLVGFLIFNFPPAKMFMGDSGSQFLGLMCAFFSIKYIWGISNVASGISFWEISLAVLICFTAPCIDTFTVVLNRIRNKKSPFIGGKDHTTHHLVYAGFSEKKVFFIFLLIGLTASLLSLVLLTTDQATRCWIAILVSSWFVLIFYFLYRNTIKFKQKNSI